MSRRRMRRIALLLLAMGTAFWLWFGIASAIGEGLGPGNFIGHLLMPGGALLALLIISWRRGAVGGVLLIVAGLIMLVGYPWMVWGRFPLTTIAFVLVIMAAPPLTSGILLLADWRLRRLSRSPAAKRP